MKTSFHGRSRRSKKATVEACMSISTTLLKDYGHFRRGWSAGSMKWTRNGRETASVSFWLALDRWIGEIHFQYAPTQSQSGEREIFDYPVSLTATPCYFGGKRWWFMCPLLKNDGITCYRRALKLYLAGDEQFGCRHCYKLTYESVQEHDKRVDALVKDPESFLDAAKRFNVLRMNLVTVKAAFKLQRKRERGKRQ